MIAIGVLAEALPLDCKQIVLRPDGILAFVYFKFAIPLSKTHEKVCSQVEMEGQELFLNSKPDESDEISKVVYFYLHVVAGEPEWDCGIAVF